MKIKKLIIENINSLYGHFEIDFEAQAFSRGIFAITGPTGSGKTTILDAICLALYCATPRMDGGNRTETLSKGAKKGLAALDFEVDGKAYSAVCAMTPSKAVSTLSSGDKIIASGLRDVPREVERITGMNSDQFCRAVLLAQGKFDAFLTAADTEKANILEQITGTALYSRIAQKVNQISKESSQIIQQQEAVCSSRKLLECDELQTKQIELSRLQALHTVLKSEIENCSTLLSSFERIRFIRSSLDENMLKMAQLEQQKKDFQPDRERLGAGEKARRIKPAYDKLSTCSELYARSLKQQQDLQIALPELEKQSLAAGQFFEEESKKFAAVQKENEAVRQLAGQVSLLDRDVEMCEKSLTQLAAERLSAENTLQGLTASRLQLDESRKNLEEEKKVCFDYLSVHTQDVSLPQEKARWGEQIFRLREQQKELQNAEKNLQNAIRQQERLQKEAAEKKLLWECACKTLGEAETIETQKKNELQQLLAGQTFEMLEKEVDLRQKTVILLQKIQSLESERSKLADGEACPLCGSTAHPYAEGNIPQSTEEENALAACKAHLAACRKLAAGCDDAGKKCLELVNACVKAEGEMNAAVQSADSKTVEVENLKQTIAQLSSGLSDAVGRLTEELAALGFEWRDFSSLPPEIDERILAYTTAVNRMGEIENKFHDNSRQSAVLAVQQEETAAGIAVIDKKTEDISVEKQQLVQKRRALFGERDPEAEISASDGALKKGQEGWNKASSENTRCAEALRQAKEMLQKTETELSVQSENLKNLTAELENVCQQENMSKEEFLKSVLKEDEYDRLFKFRADLDSRTLTLSEEKSRYESDLETLTSDFPSFFDAGICSAELEKAEAENRNILLLIGALDNELKNNEKEFQLHQAELKELENLKKKFAVWQELDSMIGGSDGFRFRRIVQRITLNNLLTSANQVLQRMNRRYELIPRANESEQLKIDVIDHWQGSEIRPSENLSGGERFQISLALALGLSSMAGEKIRIDSLFLDEGFGTLDPNSLDQALQTLSSLQRSEGKTIGIISHVQALADNISSVIEVIPQGGGRSSLNGAGVTVGKKE